MASSIHSRDSANGVASLREPFFNQGEQDEIQEHRSAQSRAKSVRFQRPRPLSRFAVICIIANRMIGTGIFRSPQTVVRETNSILGSILLWIAGAIVTVCGTHVFAEFGLAIPQIPVDFQLESVPANGGEKNYLEYMVPWPQRLMTCLYGIPFIAFGNMAGNAIVFGQYIYIAITDSDPSVAANRGIAAGVATFACFLHVFSRQLGILINNVFGSVKVSLLLALIIAAIISFSRKTPADTLASAKDNYGEHKQFVQPPGGSYGYSSSFLAIVFSYGGFNQANYVLGNISRPKRTFKWTAITTVVTISVLYIVLSVCYYGVVPYEKLVDPKAVLFDDFITRTLLPSQGRRMAAAFLSFSALGNIIVQTFTAARVKQELAKEGILPYSHFFAANREWRWRFWQHKDSDSASGKATPVGALFLHWSFCMALIAGSCTVDSMTAYVTYVLITAFTIDSLFGFCVGASMFYLRFADMFRSQPMWKRISRENKWISLAAASIFTIGNLYPLVAVWIGPPANRPQANGSKVPSWVTGTAGFGIVGVGLLWWLALEFIYPPVSHKNLHVERRYVTEIEKEERVVVTEIVYIGWKDRSMREGELALSTAVAK